MTEHTERDGMPSSESAKSESTVKRGPQTVGGLPDWMLKMKVTDLIMTEERSRGRARRRRKR